MQIHRKTFDKAQYTITVTGILLLGYRCRVSHLRSPNITVAVITVTNHHVAK